MDRLAHDERGESLIEIVITMMIVAIAVSALVAGIASATTASSQHRRHAKAEVLVRHAAELLRDRDATNGIPYASTTVTGVEYPLPSVASLEGDEFDDFGWSATVIARLDRDDPSVELADGAPDEGLQVIEIVVSDTDGNVEESASIVKRQPE